MKAIYRAGPFLRQGLPVAGHISQFADRRWWDEAPRKSPCSSSWAIQAQSCTSVFLPGTWRLTIDVGTGWSGAVELEVD